MFHGWCGHRVASLPAPANCGVCKEQPRKVKVVTLTGSKVIDTISKQNSCRGRWLIHHVVIKGQGKMARQWQQLSLEEAKRHPLYGIKNWLAVFAFGVLVSPIRSVGQLSNSARDGGLTLSQVLNSNSQIATFIKAGLAFDLALPALLLWLLFSKNQHFRVTAIAVLILQWPAYLFVAYITGGTQITGVADAFFQQFLSSLLLNAIWVTYVQRSRRVRVTFENCVVVEKIGASTVHRNLSPSAATQTTTADNDAYAEALAEIEEHRLNKGVWARSFAESGGDESKAKALYIKARASAIGNEAVWVNTQQPDSVDASPHQSQSNSDVPNWGYERGQTSPNTGSGSKNDVSRNLVWSDAILIGVVAMVGYILYQETTKQQVVVAKQFQATAPQVDRPQYEPVQSPAQAEHGPWGNFQSQVPAATGQAERSVDEASNPSSWESYVQKVRGLEAAVNRGELPQVDGVASFVPPTFSPQRSNADAAALESGQTWWRNQSGTSIHIHVKNSTSNSLAVLGLDFSESDCRSNGEKRRFFVTLPKPIASGSQSVIQFKPDFSATERTNNCLVIFSVW